MRNLTRLLAGTILALLVTAIQGPAQSTYEPYTFSTLSGLAGAPGSTDGTGSAARFNRPFGVAVDSAGNVYVADTLNHTIRKITAWGVVTTLAGLAGSPGSTDGAGSAARFNWPIGLGLDTAGNVYVADTQNNMIRKITPSGMVSTLAGYALYFGNTDGTGSAARFKNPTGVAVDSASNVYVADSSNSTIRKITPGGVVSTLAGKALSPGSADGPGINARFSRPWGVTLDSAGDLYVTDSGNFTIRKVTFPGRWVTTLAGLVGAYGADDGAGITARFGSQTNLGPYGVAVDGAGNLFVADSSNHTIREVTPASVVTTLAGLAGFPGSANGTGSTARFNLSPSYFWPPDFLHPAGGGIAVDSAGNVYVADTGNSTIRKGYAQNLPATITMSGPSFPPNGGQFGFVLTGPAGQLVVVEASTDLRNWLPIWTNTFAGTLNFTDPPSSVYLQRFYRARSP